MRPTAVGCGRVWSEGRHAVAKREVLARSGVCSRLLRRSRASAPRGRDSIAQGASALGLRLTMDRIAPTSNDESSSVESSPQILDGIAHRLRQLFREFAAG